jgi:hypothetical protein
MGKTRSKEELPFDRTWWIDRGRVIGGRFPGTPDQTESERMLARLLDIGVRTVVNLQDPNESGDNGKPFPDYTRSLKELAAQRGVEVDIHRFPIPDMGVPTVEQMQRILDVIDHAIRSGHRAYVHCWGGHGRTGTVAGCWLVRGGLHCREAFDVIERARQKDPHLAKTEAPQTRGQRTFIAEWQIGGNRGGVP